MSSFEGNAQNATEELRRDLDKRGIKWRSTYDRKTLWSVENEAGLTTYFSAWETGGVLNILSQTHTEASDGGYSMSSFKGNVYWKDQCGYCKHHRFCKYSEALGLLLARLHVVELETKDCYGTFSFWCDYYREDEELSAFLPKKDVAEPDGCDGTCHIVGKGPADLTCYIVGKTTCGLLNERSRRLFELSCGHSVILDGLIDEPNFCPKCGARVHERA